MIPHLRDATEADLPAIVAIYNQSIPGGWSTADTEPVTVESRRAWFADFDPKRRPIWVALLGEEIVGWVGLRSFYAGRPAYNATVEISTYVADAHQKKGIGAYLKRKMIEHCPKLGVTTLLSFYFDHNAATRKINEAFGFETTGHLTNIAVLQGQPRGLLIGALRIPPA